MSPALAGELHHLLGCGEAGPEAGQVRIALASLLGWAGGLVISMLSQLEAVRGKPQVAGPGRPSWTETGSWGSHGISRPLPGVPRRGPGIDLPVGVADLATVEVTGAVPKAGSLT